MSAKLLHGKVIATSGGFGAARCNALYERGATLALFDIDNAITATEYHHD